MRDVVSRPGAVLADDLERAAIHVLDRACIDAIRRSDLPRRDRRVAQRPDEREPLRLGRHGIHASTMFGARRERAERDLRDHSERAFGSDEEIDEVHVGRGVVAGRALRHLRHRGRSAPAPRRARARLEHEPAVTSAMRRRASARAPCRRQGRPSAPRPSSRVLPYLKVAAPAALVATMPPAKAPVKVGTGGNHARPPRAVPASPRPSRRARP